MAQRLSGSVLVAAALALGCARPYYLAPDAPPGSELSTLLVLPLNFERTPPDTWTDGLERLSEQLRAYLSSTGRHVERVELSEVLPVWQEAVDSVGGLLGPGARFDAARYEAARTQLARRLASGRDVDAVVLPSVLSRIAQADGRSHLRWDGVVRRIPLEAGDPEIEPPGLAGSFEASSLRVSVFDPWGERLFERVRGLEPLESVRFDGTRLRYAERSDLFRDEALLQEEVRLVFEPLIEAP